MEAVLTQAINRLEAVLAGETAALYDGLPINFGEVSNRKNQSLLELSRISRGLDPHSVSPGLKARLDGLRHRLEDNRRILRLHMEATDEISEIIAKTMQDAESDGTYCLAGSGLTRNK